jgi:hypothetical protein
MYVKILTRLVIFLGLLNHYSQIDSTNQQTSSMINEYPQSLSSAKSLPIELLKLVNIVPTVQGRSSMARFLSNPLSILMNFNNDGSSSLMIIDRIEGVKYGEHGHCQHGKIWNPNGSACRPIFCQDDNNLVSDALNCKDDNAYMNEYDDDHMESNEQGIQFTIDSLLCSFSFDPNNKDTYDCENENGLDLLQSNPHFDGLLLELIESKLTPRPGITFSITNHNISSIIYKNMDPSFKSTVFYPKTADVPSCCIQKHEQIVLTLYPIKSNPASGQKKPKTDDKMSVYLELLDNKNLSLLGHNITLLNIFQPQKQHSNWCTNKENNDIKTSYRSLSDYRILVSTINNAYYVYINKTNFLYSTGSFEIQLTYNLDMNVLLNNNLKLIRNFDYDTDTINNTDDKKKEFHYYNWPNINQSKQTVFQRLGLQDVTDLFLHQATAFITTCDRLPRIVKNCQESQTVRLHICEVEFFHVDSSIYHPLLDHYFTSKEYQFDANDTDYVHICKESSRFFWDLLHTRLKMSAKTSILHMKISSYISFVFNVISIISMILTLLTYGLFKELRNVPGWNVINLTCALLIAQSSFLLGAIIENQRFVCFLSAIVTHYGFLVSFFWMSVIAFDLYRNFRNTNITKSLQMVNLRHRLIPYVIYAWITPFLIVSIAVIIDLIPMKVKPCYGGYAKECIFEKNIKYEQSGLLAQYSDDYDSYNYRNFTSGYVIPVKNRKHINCRDFGQNYINYTQKSCLIQNGRVNFYLFGLPLLIIIIVNAIFYLLAIYNIRKMKQNSKNSTMRRFSRVKLPSDKDVKFYIQMASILGFSWTIGFFFTTFKINSQHVVFFVLLYIFTLSNASIGIFIFFAFICRREIWKLYEKRLKITAFNLKKSINYKSDMNRKYQRDSTSSIDSQMNRIISISAITQNELNSNSKNKEKMETSNHLF